MADDRAGSEDLARHEPGWGMGDAVLGMVVSLFLSVVAFAVALGITGDEDLEDIPLWGTAVLQLPLWAGLLGVVWFASTRKGTGSLRRDFGLRMELRDVPVGLLAGLAGQIGIGLTVLLLYDALGIDADRLGETAEALAERAVTAVDVVFLVLIVVVGAPVVEELFYRGLWLRSIERRTGRRAVAVVGSSLVFGLAHLQLFDLVSLTLAGLLFAWLAVRAGRLGPAIWAHVAFNLTAVISLLATS